MAKDFAPDWGTVPGAKQDPGSTSAFDFFGGMASSIVSAPFEMFGAEPLDAARDFRRDNPTAGVISEFVGGAIPYVGWGRFSRSIKPFEDKIQSLGNAKQAPILTGAKQEMARFAPLEAARIGGQWAFGGEGATRDQLWEALLNTGIAGVAGGVVGALSAGGRDKIRPVLDVIGDDAQLHPPQKKIRDIQKALAEGRLNDKPDLAEAAKGALPKYQQDIRREMAPEGQRHVFDFGDGTSAGDINRLFTPEKPRGEGLPKISKLRPVVSEVKKEPAFRSQKELLDEVTAAGLPQNWEAFVQYPRFIQVNEGNAAIGVKRNLARDMKPVNENTWIQQEADDGLYVMVKRYEGDGAVGSKYVAFKTDSPGFFAPVEDAWVSRLEKWAKFLRDETPEGPSGSSLLDFGRDLGRQMPELNGLQAKDDSIRRMLRALGLENEKGTPALISGLQRSSREFLAPLQHQFTKAGEAGMGAARRIMEVSKHIHDFALGEIEHQLHGKQIGAGGSLFHDLFARKQPDLAGVLSKIDQNFTDADRAAVHAAWNGLMSPAEAKAAIPYISDRALGVLKQLAEFDKKNFGELNTIQGAVGRTPTEMLPNHYGLPRTWEGDWRLPILDDAGRLVYMASGTPKSAVAEAETVIAKALADGKTWFSDMRPKLKESLQDQEFARRMATGSDDYISGIRYRQDYLNNRGGPARLQEREGIPGYYGEKSPWETNEALRKVISDGYVQLAKHRSELAANNVLARDLALLQEANPRVFNQVKQRRDLLYGRQGPIGEITNKVADSMLARFLGKDSATKIAHALNEVQFHLQFGFGNVAFSAINMLGILQTTLPEIAFVLNASRRSLAQYYSVVPVAGADGAIKHSLGVLEPMRLLKEGFKALGKPSPDLRQAFERAAGEGVIMPRMMEEFLGETSSMVRNYRDVLKGDVPWSKFIKHLSALPATASEKLARAHSFATAHIIGRDLMGLKGDQLYYWSKSFTNRTMFGYGAVDRAKIMTGPMGSIFGLFKNWQAHYIGNMMTYAGEMTRGNYAPFLWMMGSTGAVAGASGLPFVFAGADKMARLFSNKGAMETVYDFMGESGAAENRPAASDAFLMGLPAFLPTLLGAPGIATGGSAAAPFADPARDASMLFSFVHLDRAKAIGKVLGSAMDAWTTTGQNPMTQPEVHQQFMRAFAPKTFFRTAAAWDDKMIRSLSTGYPMIKELSFAERAMYMAGFNPTYIELNHRINDQLFSRRQDLQNHIENYGTAVFNAVQRGRGEEVNDLMMRAAVQGVPLDSIWRSVQSRRSKDASESLDRSFKPQDVQSFSSMLQRRQPELQP